MCVGWSVRSRLCCGLGLGLGFKVRVREHRLGFKVRVRFHGYGYGSRLWLGFKGGVQG